MSKPLNKLPQKINQQCGQSESGVNERTKRKTSTRAFFGFDVAPFHVTQPTFIIISLTEKPKPESDREKRTTSIRNCPGNYRTSGFNSPNSYEAFQLTLTFYCQVKRQNIVFLSKFNRQ